VYRLCTAFEARGAAGLASAKRGRPSHRKLSLAVREQALGLIRERYRDFGPTLACEKLVELHGLTVSVETVRSCPSATPHPPQSRESPFSGGVFFGVGA